MHFLRCAVLLKAVRGLAVQLAGGGTDPHAGQCFSSGMCLSQHAAVSAGILCSCGLGPLREEMCCVPCSVCGGWAMHCGVRFC